MTTRLFDRKQVDHESDCLISGFIREMQRVLPDNNTFYIIPELVNYECLRFYHIPERFIKCSVNLSINDKGDRVEYRSNPDSYSKEVCAYGNVKISAASKFIHCWKFKIVKYPYCIYIGITSATKIDVERRFTFDEDNDYYAFSNGGYKYDLKHATYDGYDKSKLKGFYTDDYVLMELNPIQRTLKYYVYTAKDDGDKQLKCTFKNINFDDTTYRMIICVECQDSVVQLIEFTKRFNE